MIDRVNSKNNLISNKKSNDEMKMVSSNNLRSGLLKEGINDDDELTYVDSIIVNQKIDPPSSIAMINIPVNKKENDRLKSLFDYTPPHKKLRNNKNLRAASSNSRSSQLTGKYSESLKWNSGRRNSFSTFKEKSQNRLSKYCMNNESAEKESVDDFSPFDHKLSITGDLNLRTVDDIKINYEKMKLLDLEPLLEEVKSPLYPKNISSKEDKSKKRSFSSICVPKSNITSYNSRVPFSFSFFLNIYLVKEILRLIPKTFFFLQWILISKEKIHLIC
jgi:hypothetical protein